LSPLDFSDSLKLIKPEIAISATLVIIVLVDLIFKNRKSFLPVISLIGLLVSGYFAVEQLALNAFAFGQIKNNALIVIDPFAAFFKLIFILTTALIVLFSISSSEIKEQKNRHGEYYTLIFGMLLGMSFLSSASDLIMIYISIELLSLSSYVLAGFVKDSIRNSEASLKYVIYGSVSSGIMLFGISIVYGLTGSTNLFEINSALSRISVIDITFVLSIIMIVAGFGFKISIVPFHFWTPDVYEGAPITITAYLSVASKAAGFAVLIRFIINTFLVSTTSEGYWNLLTLIDWQSLLVVLSIITMTLGNFAALWQDNLKRMLAYSSIAHAGYILLGIAVLSNQGLIAVLIYFAIYLFMNLGAFYVVMLIANKLGSENIDDYKGLGASIPLLGVSLAVFLVSLTGLPPTAGFIAKLYLFIALLDANMVTVAFIALLNTVVSLYYYVRVLKNLYLVKTDSDKPVINIAGLELVVLLVLIIPTFVLGVYFTPLVNLAKESVQILGF
jgi:NADH-quinone oxidoreductase subunit N